MHALQLPSMTCGHCVSVVRQTVLAFDPAASVDIDLPNHRARVHSVHDSAADRVRLSAALTEAGYAPVA